MLDPQERRLLLLLPGPIIAADDEGAILYASQEVCTLLEYNDPSELAGRSLTAIMPARFVRRHMNGFNHYLTTGRSRLLGKRVRVFALSRTGEERPIDLNIRMFRRPDGSDLIIGALTPARAKEAHVEFSIQRMEEALVDHDYEPV